MEKTAIYALRQFGKRMRRHGLANARKKERKKEPNSEVCGERQENRKKNRELSTSSNRAHLLCKFHVIFHLLLFFCVSHFRVRNVTSLFTRAHCASPVFQCWARLHALPRAARHITILAVWSGRWQRDDSHVCSSLARWPAWLGLRVISQLLCTQTQCQVFVFFLHAYRMNGAIWRRVDVSQCI